MREGTGTAAGLGEWEWGMGMRLPAANLGWTEVNGWNVVGRPERWQWQ